MSERFDKVQEGLPYCNYTTTKGNKMTAIILKDGVTTTYHFDPQHHEAVSAFYSEAFAKGEIQNYQLY
jgi:hypothetical protein